MDSQRRIWKSGTVSTLHKREHWRENFNLRILTAVVMIHLIPNQYILYVFWLTHLNEFSPSLSSIPVSVVGVTPLSSTFLIWLPFLVILWPTSSVSLWLTLFPLHPTLSTSVSRDLRTSSSNLMWFLPPILGRISSLFHLHRALYS